MDRHQEPMTPAPVPRMPEPRCDRCVFWAGYANGFGECDFNALDESRVRFVIRKRVCTEKHIWVFTPIENPVEKENFRASLMTPGDWFCADFQEKEIETDHG